MGDRETLQQTLTMAKTVLGVLEEQAAGYTMLTIPPHLKIQRDEKRQEVASLQMRLDQLDGQAADLSDNLLHPPVIFGTKRRNGPLPRRSIARRTRLGRDH